MWLIFPIFTDRYNEENMVYLVVLTLQKYLSLSMKTYILALSTLVGTTIGVGLFGLPFVASKIGFIAMFVYFIVIGFVIRQLQLMFAEVTLQNKKFQNELPGYCQRMLGKRYKTIAMITMTLAIYGAILAYIILGGEFLFQLLEPLFGGKALYYQVAYFLIGALLIYKGINSIAETEFFMLVALIALVVVLFMFGLPQIQFEHLQGFSPKHIFLPYGVVIFSLWGVNVIPTIKNIVGDNTTQLKKVIGSGMIITVIVYLVFVITVLGVSGTQTTTDALNGMVPLLSNKVLALGYFFGVLTTFTSFIALGHALKNSFMNDYEIHKELAWFLSLFPPLALFALGIKNFLYVINITGAITLAVQGILITVLYLHILKTPKLSRAMQIRMPKTFVYAIACILTAGIFTELVFTFIKG